MKIFVPKTLKRASRDRRGGTVIIAMGICFLLLAFSIGIAANVDRTQRSINAFKKSSQAQMLAESAMEILRMEAGKRDAGYSLNADKCNDFIKGEMDVFDPVTNPDGPTIVCTIEGTNENSKFTEGYTVPLRSHGNAGSSCMALTKYDIDHPCNWGKLTFGSSYSGKVAIPLYYDTEAGIQNPEATGLNSLEVFVRTPCNNPGNKYAEGCDRYELDHNGFAGEHDTRHDETLVNWQISAECGDGNCALTPWRITEDKNARLTYGQYTNTEIYESKINKYAFSPNSPVLNGDDRGYISYENYPLTAQALKQYIGPDPPKLIQYATNEYNEVDSHGKKIVSNIHKPILQISMIADSLFDNSLKPVRIPYLEYQIRTNAPIASDTQLFTVEVQYEGQSFKKEKAIQQRKQLFDFAIQN